MISSIIILYTMFIKLGLSLYFHGKEQMIEYDDFFIILVGFIIYNLSLAIP